MLYIPRENNESFTIAKISSRQKSLIRKIILPPQFRSTWWLISLTVQGNFPVEGKLACTRLSVSEDEWKQHEKSARPPLPSPHAAFRIFFSIRTRFPWNRLKEAFLTCLSTCSFLLDYTLRGSTFYVRLGRSKAAACSWQKVLYLHSSLHAWGTCGSLTYSLGIWNFW